MPSTLDISALYKLVISYVIVGDQETETQIEIRRQTDIGRQRQR